MSVSMTMSGFAQFLIEKKSRSKCNVDRKKPVKSIHQLKNSLDDIWNVRKTKVVDSVGRN